METIRHEQYMKRMARGPIRKQNDDHQDEMVYSPPHYNQAGIEASMLSGEHRRRVTSSICKATALKYLWRYRYKNAAAGPDESRWYLDKLIREYQKRD